MLDGLLLLVGHFENEIEASSYKSQSRNVTTIPQLKFITILTFSYKILVTTIESDPNLQSNILKFGCGINYKYEGQFC